MTIQSDKWRNKSEMTVIKIPICLNGTKSVLIGDSNFCNGYKDFMNFDHSLTTEYRQRFRKYINQ